MNKITVIFFVKGIDKRDFYAILKVQKENNLQEMLARNINTGVSYYEVQVAARAGQGSFINF